MKRMNKKALKIGNNVLNDLDIEEIFDGLKIDAQLSKEYPGQSQTMESPAQDPGYYIGFNGSFEFKEDLTEQEKQVVINSLTNNLHTKEEAAEILEHLGPRDEDGNGVIIEPNDVTVDAEFENKTLKLYVSVEK